MFGRRRLAVVLAVMALGVGIAAAPSAVARTATPDTVASHPAGDFGSPFTLSTFGLMDSYDVAASSDGTAYIGWISSDDNEPREVHLCTLPITASACTGGIQTIASGDAASARDMNVKVLPNGVVALFWQDTTSASQTGPRGDVIKEATAPSGLGLTDGFSVADAPSNGELLDLQVDPQGTVWLLGYAGLPATSMELRKGLTATPQPLNVGIEVGHGQLAIAGGAPFVAYQEAGKVTSPDHWGAVTNGSWAFHSLANTWTVDTNAVLTETAHGPRMVTSVGNSTYRPVVSAYTGSGFGPVHYSNDRSGCTPANHDGAADASGRLLDASYECGKVSVDDFVDAYNSVVLQFPTGGIPTLSPQIASGTRGIATVAWTTEPTSGTTPLRLWVRRVRLPDLTHLTVVRSYAGAASVTGPVSCLPAVDVTVSSNAGAMPGWQLITRSFRIGSTGLPATATLDGTSLTPGAYYTLTSSATFGYKSERKTVTAAQTFRACPNS